MNRSGNSLNGAGFTESLSQGGSLVPQNFKQLKDTGRLENNLKEGYWTEYSVDSAGLKEHYKFVVHGDTTNWNFDLIPQMEYGNYLHGRREGVWTTYISVSQIKLEWFIEEKTEYRLGLKNGKQIVYQYDGRRPLIVANYKNDIQQGVEMDYSTEPPYQLKSILTVVNGVRWPFAEYYKNGRRKVLFKDTTIDNERLKYFQNFDTTGLLLSTGYYVSDSIPHGTWTVFYDNGKIKSSAIYRRGVAEGPAKNYNENGELIK